MSWLRGVSCTHAGALTGPSCHEPLESAGTISGATQSQPLARCICALHAKTGLLYLTQ